jgi:amino acid transporter
MAAAAASAGAQDNKLKRNAIGLPSAMAMSLAFISPTIGVIFISALIANQAGASAPFAFILGTVGVLLMANTLAEFTKRVPSAGTFYTFAGQAAGRHVGFIVGWLLFLTYAFQSPINTNLFGFFVPQVLLRDFGVDLTAYWWVFGLAIIGFVAWLGYESIKYSLRLDIIFVALEVLVMAILLLYIVFTGGAEGQSPQSFTPSLAPGPAATNPMGGIWMAFIFILFAFFGFESSTTVAEECENPKRNIPIALLGSVGLTGLWFIFALYAVVVGFGPSAAGMEKLGADPVPLDTLARQYLGHYYAVFIDVAALMANVAVLIAIHNANFRIFYAMGREGVLPGWLGKTHPIHKTPYHAIFGFSAFAAVLMLATGFMWGPQAAFGYNGFFSSLGILPIFILVNILLVTFMWRKYRNEFSWWRHGLLPILGAVTFTAALWFSVVPLPAAPLSYFPAIIVGWVVLGLVIMAWIQRRNPRQLDTIGKTMFVEVDEEVEAEIADGALGEGVPVQTGA